MTSVVVMGMVIGVQAATVYNWIGGTGDWSVGTNWDQGENPQSGAHLKSDCEQVNIPGSSSIVSGPYSLALDDNNNNNPVVTVSNGASWSLGNAFWMADNPGSNGTLKVLSGATVNIGSLLDVGNGPGTGHTADAIVDGGNINVTGNWGDLRVGVSNGTSTMTVSGDSNVSMIDSLYIDLGGSSGTVTLNDGQIIVGTDPSSASNNDGGTVHFGSNGTLYSNGGKLLVSGMTETEMQSHIDSGDIVPSISYSITTMNVEGKDYTALVPEPASIGLLVLGFGLGFRRRR